MLNFRFNRPVFKRLQRSFTRKSAAVFSAPPAKPQAQATPPAAPAAKPAPQQQAAPAAAQPAMSAPAPAHDGSRVFSSPLARRLAKDAGIDVSRIQGSGPHGRVVARDVEAAQSGKGLKAPGAAPGAAYVPPAGGE